MTARIYLCHPRAICCPTAEAHAYHSIRESGMSLEFGDSGLIFLRCMRGECGKRSGTFAVGDMIFDAKEGSRVYMHVVRDRETFETARSMRQDEGDGVRKVLTFIHDQERS